MAQPAGGHEHGWRVESSHPTSSGLVVYVRCGGCGMRRLDLQEHPLAVPAALSREIQGAGHAPGGVPGQPVVSGCRDSPAAAS